MHSGTPAALRRQVVDGHVERRLDARLTEHRVVEQRGAIRARLARVGARAARGASSATPARVPAAKAGA